MLTNYQAILDDLNAANKLLDCATLSQEEYDDAVYLLSQRSRELQASVESMVAGNAVSHPEVIRLSSAADIGLEALDDLTTVYTGLQNLNVSLETTPPETTTQRAMAQLAVNAYANRLGIPSESVSTESLSGTLKSIWDALVKLIKSVVGRIRDFFKAIWRFLTGKKRTLKKTEKEAKNTSATDSSVAGFLGRQNEEIRKAKTNDFSGKKESPLEGDVVPSGEREEAEEFLKKYRNFMAKQHQVLQTVLPTSKKNDTQMRLPGNDDTLLEVTETEIEVEATRFGRKTLAFITPPNKQGIAGTHFIEVDQIIAFASDIENAIDNIALTTEVFIGPHGTGLIEQVTRQLTKNNSDIHEIIQFLPSQLAAGHEHPEGGKAFVGPNGTYLRYNKKDSGWVVNTSYHYSDNEYLAGFPNPQQVSDMVTGALRLADKEKTLKSIEKDLRKIEKVIEDAGDALGESLTKEQIESVQLFTRIMVTRFLLPTIKAGNEAVAEYVSFVDLVANQATELYGCDLASDTR